MEEILNLQKTGLKVRSSLGLQKKRKQARSYKKIDKFIWAIIAWLLLLVLIMFFGKDFAVGSLQLDIIATVLAGLTMLVVTVLCIVFIVAMLNGKLKLRVSKRRKKPSS